MNGNGGGAGGGSHADRKHFAREHLNRINKLAKAGGLATDQIPDALKMAQTVAEDVEASNRDRLAAMKLIATFAKLGFDADVQQDKMHRLDNGDPTENNRITVDYGEEGRQWSRK